MADLEHVVPKVFKPLWEPARWKGAFGGRGSGKSYNFGAMAVATQIGKLGARGVCVREVQRTLRESAQRLIHDHIDRMGVADRFVRLQAETRSPGGGSIHYVGMQDHTAESFKSFEGVDWVWIEEAQTLSDHSLEILGPTVRKPGSEIWASWNPRLASDPIDRTFRGPIAETIQAEMGAGTTVLVEANYVNNQFFTDELEMERRRDRLLRPDRYDHIWWGAYEPQALGALWQRSTINERRVREMHVSRGRTVVAVDPAVSNTDASNYHGIVVACAGEDRHGYILEDASMHGTPTQWSRRVVEMFDKWDADAVVIEVNQGGDMCRHTLQTQRRNLPIKEVRATRGKHVRAEPIAALYGSGMVHHVGLFAEMEDQMCLFTAHGWDGPDSESPDRAEAAIWALTHLFWNIISDTERSQKQDDDAEAAFYTAPTVSSWMS